MLPGKSKRSKMSTYTLEYVSKTSMSNSKLLIDHSYARVEKTHAFGYEEFFLGRAE